MLSTSGERATVADAHGRVHALSLLLNSATEENSRLRRENMLLRSRLVMRQEGSRSPLSPNRSQTGHQDVSGLYASPTLNRTPKPANHSATASTVEDALENALQLARHRAAEKHLLSSQVAASLYQATLTVQERAFMEEQQSTLDVLEEANAISLSLERRNEALQVQCEEQEAALHTLMETLVDRNLYIDELEAIVRNLRQLEQSP